VPVSGTGNRYQKTGNQYRFLAPVGLTHVTDFNYRSVSVPEQLDVQLLCLFCVTVFMIAGARQVTLCSRLVSSLPTYAEADPTDLCDRHSKCEQTDW